MRKAQGGINAAILVAIIAGLIILYILFLPADERERILENKTDDKDGDDGEEDEGDILLREFPGSIDTIKKIDDRSIPEIFLFETTNAKELERINPFIVRNGWFDKQPKSVSFGIDDLENTDNVVLSFKAKEYKGVLTIKLNGEIIFESEVESETVAPVRLKKSLLSEVNILEFSVSSVGYKFWSTNEYSLEDIKIVGDITDKSKQESTNTFTLTVEEKSNIERAYLRFVPYCSSEARVGVLDIFVNNRNVFSAVPVCEDPYKQEIHPGILEAGVNTVIFRTAKGSYSVEQIEMQFEEKDVTTVKYYFEVNQSVIDSIEDDEEEAILTIEFVEDENNRADLNINDKFFTIDEDERIFSKNIDRYIEEGNNFIEIEPRTRLEIFELKVELRER